MSVLEFAAMSEQMRVMKRLSQERMDGIDVEVKCERVREKSCEQTSALPINV